MTRFGVEIALLLLTTATVSFAIEVPTAPTTQPGIKLTIETLDARQTDQRAARLIALCVPDKSNPTPFLPSGRFRAVFDGFINLRLRGEYTFVAAGTGEIEVIANGESVLKASGADLSATRGKPVRLKKGANPIEVKYIAPPSGDAVLRLSWAERNAPFEPIPPTVLTHESNAALMESSSIRAGRELFATLRCLQCHVSSEIRSGAGAMPELSADAPNLDDVGARLNAQWIARWIDNPHVFRADASMPRIFRSSKSPEDVDPRAVDVAKFLTARGQPRQGVVAADEQTVATGARLFTSLGCIACHVAPGEKSSDDETRVPLCNVKQKFQQGALVEFLRAPEQHYKWIRMPNFALQPSEATQLAAFLIAQAPDDSMPAIDFSKADAGRGEALFNSAGCANCHAPAQKSALKAPGLSAIANSASAASGCLAAAADAPDFALSSDQRNQLQAFLKLGVDSLNHDAAPEFAERQVRVLNCTACHTRDSQQDRWSSLDAEIQTIEAGLKPAEHAGNSEIGGDQTRPLLTWVGDKLRPEWMASFIAGQVPYKPRPWLVARMPGFPARAQGLADGFSLEHGWPLTIPVEAAPEPEMAQIGKRLIGRVNGFSCNQCHAIGASPALVPFDSPAPNFSHTHDRLRKDFYHRWVRTPLKYQPGTRMPQYSDADGKTAYKDVLDGSADRQFEAIWQYLRAGEKIVPPE